MGIVKLWNTRVRLSHLMPDSWRVRGFTAALPPTSDRNNACEEDHPPTSSGTFSTPCDNLTVSLQHRLPASGPVFGWRRRLQIRDELVPGVEQFLLVDDVGTAEDGASLVAGEEQGEPPRVREVLLFLAARGLRSRV